MATHSSVLAWRIPGMGEPGGLPSMGSHRVRRDWSDLAAAARGSFIAIQAYLKKQERNQINNLVQFSSVTQSCPTLCDPMECSPPGPSVHGKSTGVGCHCLLRNLPLSTAFTVSHRFWVVVFSFLRIFWFLFWFLLWFVGYSAACCSASICWNF